MSSFLGKFKKSNEEEDVNSFLEDRTFWLNTLQDIALPVLKNLKKDSLKKNIPFESKNKDMSKFTAFEAFSRVYNSIAPWLELGAEDTEEGILRAKYTTLVIDCISRILNSSNKDYVNFKEPKQTLMDAAFFCQALLRSKTSVWNNLPIETQAKLIEEIKNTRVIAPYENYWLLFTSIIEATLLEFTGECDIERLTYAINKFMNDWYLGDGEYSDGPRYNTDFNNSIVIHPMLIDVLKVMDKFGIDNNDYLDTEIMRASRYASKLERVISPEGTYPLNTRFATYRSGIFHTLALASLLNILPKNIEPAQVRAALTKVIENHFVKHKNFDKKGWLTVGLNGHQLELAEKDIDTGSVYACAFVFLPLGLSIDDAFWAQPPKDWTTVKAFNGRAVLNDQTINF